MINYRMKNKLINKSSCLFIVCFISILCDQVSKYFISVLLNIENNYPVLNKVFSFYLIYNSGAAFSIFQGQTLYLIIFSFIVSFFILIYILKNKDKISLAEVLGWSFILGGTIGNLIDRIRLGHVVDFIKLNFISFPIFNLADICINLGAFIILVHTLVNSKNIFIILRNRIYQYYYK